jgi:anti-sigma regulatory factor (Ser/Thr protein kinase)
MIEDAEAVGEGREAIGGETRCTASGFPRLQGARGMDDELKLHFAGGNDAPVRARYALLALDGALADSRDTVRLLVTELVSNSVVHAGADEQCAIDLMVSADTDRVRVEVEDHGPGFEPRRSEPDLERGGGFGLFLVEKLADRWGVEPERPTRVWFELDHRGQDHSGNSD